MEVHKVSSLCFVSLVWFDFYYFCLTLLIDVWKINCIKTESLVLGRNDKLRIPYSNVNFHGI